MVEELVDTPEQMLAVLLKEDQIILNSFWFKKDWPKEDQVLTSVYVLCNDVFFWACADAEPLPYSEIENLYNHYIKDPVWGVAVWCIKQRKHPPQDRVYACIKEIGDWDIDNIVKNFDDNIQTT